MIAYKVVQPGSMCSCVADGIYKKVYSPGAIIEADWRTIGIFCFESYEAAQTWKDSGYNNWLIIEVRGIGEGIRPTKMIPATYIDDSSPIKDYDDFLTATRIPKGTICFRSVEVLNV